MKEALELHAEALGLYAEDARSLTGEQWRAPREPGKWSPAEITAHLVTSYEPLLSELDGGEGMRVVTGRLKRSLLRWLVFRRILRTGTFPGGAPAPRETRPARVEEDREAALAELARRGDAFAEAVRSSEPGTRLTHAYFGTAGLGDAVTLCARHILHHRGQLRAVLSRAPSG